jgi:secreted protein with Ig-like and vWFA domain
VSTGNDDLDAWKRQRTVTLAFELADSGRYEDFTDVAYALQFGHGLATAQALIDDADTRRALNRRCGDARDALTPAAQPMPPAPPASLAMHEPAADADSIAAATPLPEFTDTPSILRRLGLMLGRADARAIKAV